MTIKDDLLSASGNPEAFCLELAKRFQAISSAKQAPIASLGTTTNLVGVDGTASNAAPLVGTEARLDAIEAKVDAILAAMRAYGSIATSGPS